MPFQSILTDKHTLSTVTGLIAVHNILVVGLALLVAGCAQTSPPDPGTPILTSAQSEITATPAAASQTPLPATATTTSEPGIDVPAWLIDPDADGVMTKTVKYNKQLSKAEYGVALFNASSGERYDLPLKDISAYFWMPDGKQIGLLLGSDGGGLYLVDGATGKIARFPLTENITKHAIYGAEPHPLIPSGSDVTAPDFFLFNPPGRYYQYLDSISADRRYKATLNQPVILVEDLKTGEQTQVPQAEGLFASIPVWSPVDDLLAVVQGTEDPFSLEAPPGVRTLSIYDASTGKFLASHPASFDRGVWSPDGTRILYGAGKPCILDWQQGRSSCLDNGRSFHGGEQVVDYDWSPDGSAVSYVYFSESSSTGGICIQNLSGGEPRCPTMDIPELVDHLVRQYRWSPDGQYLIFTSDTDSYPGADYSTDPQIGIVDVTTGAYWYPLEDLVFDTPDAALWRPEIPS